METVACHNVSHSVPFDCASLLVNVYCSGPLVCFKVSGFCYTIYTGSSPGHGLDILFQPHAMEILLLWICKTSPFTCPSSL